MEIPQLQPVNGRDLKNKRIHQRCTPSGYPELHGEPNSVIKHHYKSKVLGQTVISKRLFNNLSPQMDANLQHYKNSEKIVNFLEP
jgi:hypothetical protein